MAYQQQPYGQPPYGYQAPPVPAHPPHSPHSPYGQAPTSPYPQQPYGANLQPAPPGQYPPSAGYPSPGAYQQSPHSPVGYQHQQPSPAYGQYPGSPQPGYPPPAAGLSPGYPPPGSYGQPSPYLGQQPPQSPYVASPYGAAPGSPYAWPPTPPSLGYGDMSMYRQQYNGTTDADALRRAMKGFGTDEKALIRVLGTRDVVQLHNTRVAFDSKGRNLIKDLRSELRGWLELGCVLLARGPLEADAHLARESLAGPGTNEALLNDVLLGKCNADINAIKMKYSSEFSGRSLEADVRSDLSGDVRTLFDFVLSARKDEDSVPLLGFPETDALVMQLFNATEGKIGTDEKLLTSILTTKNDAQLRALSAAYEQKFRTTLEDVIRKETSGHYRSALLFLIRNAVNKADNAAQLLEAAMKGMGTKDMLLTSRVVRYSRDRQNFMPYVRSAYQQRYQRDLVHRIQGETSGDYQTLLVVCVNDPQQVSRYC